MLIPAVMLQPTKAEIISLVCLRSYLYLQFSANIVSVELMFDCNLHFGRYYLANNYLGNIIW